MEEKEFNELVAKLELAAGKKIDEQFKEALKSLDVEALKALKPENIASKEEVDKMATELKEAKERIAQLMEGNVGISQKTIHEQVSKFIADNTEEIKSLHSKGHGVVEFEVKAVATVTTGSATSPDGIPALVGTQLAPPSNVNLRSIIVDRLVSSIGTDLAAYPYTETLPKDGDFSFVAEGAAKPQIDFKIETRYAQPVKCAAWIKLTEESVKDIKGLQSIATDYLRKKHDLKKQQGILFGDGVAPNPKGATNYGRLFVAGDMANKVASPNFMDVVNAAITDVYVTHNYQDEMPYMPNLVVINPIDFYLELVSAKDGEGRPLYPTASLFNFVNIGGVTIIPEQSIPTGKIFVADMSKYNVTDYVGYTVKIGWVNDDFIKNQFVILGESRFHAFVKKLDEQAFIYDDIDTIKTAITAA